MLRRGWAAKPSEIAAIRWEVEEKLIASHGNL
jgi:hypothetical protein